MTASRSLKIRKVLQYYLIDCQTPLGKFIDIVIIALNLAICALLVIETYPMSEKNRALLWRIEIGIVFFFIIEYAIRLYAAPGRWRQLRDKYSLIDLIAILPTLWLLLAQLGTAVDLGFIRVIRSFRVLRIFRFLRFTADPFFFFGNISPSLLRVVRLLFTIIMIFFVSAVLFYHVESQVNANVSSFGDAFYFTVVCLTTVGFGDITPQSESGRWVTVLMILSGIILIPWQASRIVREWIHMAQKKQVVCQSCGLIFHDKDASHCKSCGQVIFQKYEGD
ncbi:MAG: ion transporter [Desulfobacteraceae bacterium]|nr:ion transporter [Desulfobacteraceae bacterium]